MDPSAQAQDTKQCNICYCIWCKKIFPQRHCLTVMLIFSTMIMYAQRVCLSMAIVHMTNFVDKSAGKDKVLCTAGNRTITKMVIQDSQYDWNESVQSYILLSFYFGYMLGNFFIGFLIELFGGRWCLLLGSIVSSVLTLTLPLLAYNMHWGFICGSRAITGMAQTPLTACSTNLISRWILEEKKSSTTTIVLTSYTLGVIVGNVGSGFIMQLTLTWCWVFYFFGSIGVIWCMIFFFYGYSFPGSHPHITEKELKYLEPIPKPGKRKIPIWRMLSDISVWMFFLGFFGSDFTMYLIITNMPKYFVDVLGYNTSLTGMVLMGPPAAGALGGVIFGLLADYIIGKKYMKKITFRMIGSTIGLPISSGCLLIMVLGECNSIIACIMVCLCMFLKSAFYAGAGAMAMDLTLNYGGLLYGYCNVAGGFAGMIAPYIVGSIAHQNTFPQWRIVQCFTLAFATAVLIPILMFSKADRKDWDYGPDETKPPVDETPIRKRVWSCYKPI